MHLIKNKTPYQNLVYPKLPRAGLGNMLLVWANAIVFAHINSFPVVAPNWGRIKIGPYIRNEKDKRSYGSYFSTQNYISKSKYLATRMFQQYCPCHNPSLAPVEEFLTESQMLNPNIFIFDCIPHWSDYFKGIKEHQFLVKERLFADIYPRLLGSILNNPAPEIALHVRMSDFKKIKQGEDFKKLGNARTPLDWFINVIIAIRAVTKSTVPAIVFSDGYDDELQELLSLPAVTRSPQASAINDILILSRSKILIASSGSTFSSWASYLGGCTTIWHPAHFHASVFSESTGQVKFEGGFNPDIDEMPDLLKKNIQDLFC
jgi:hypothetical protein